jgi:hypothetical protein
MTTIVKSAMVPTTPIVPIVMIVVIVTAVAATPVKAQSAIRVRSHGWWIVAVSVRISIIRSVPIWIRIRIRRHWVRVGRSDAYTKPYGSIRL